MKSCRDHRRVDEGPSRGSTKRTAPRIRQETSWHVRKIVIVRFESASICACVRVHPRVAKRCTWRNHPQGSTILSRRDCSPFDLSAIHVERFIDVQSFADCTYQITSPSSNRWAQTCKDKGPVTLFWLGMSRFGDIKIVRILFLNINKFTGVRIVVIWTLFHDKWIFEWLIYLEKLIGQTDQFPRWEFSRLVTIYFSKFERLIFVRGTNRIMNITNVINHFLFDTSV